MALSADDASERYHKRRERQDARSKQLPGEDDEPLPPPADTIRSGQKPKRNEPCPCGSGKKYKQCCGRN
ncbi:MAG: SEC-C metal-binding domain-containing protein [Phycisphaerae bacterium]